MLLPLRSREFRDGNKVFVVVVVAAAAVESGSLPLCVDDTTID
jgi:hypothetical protein